MPVQIQEQVSHGMLQNVFQEALISICSKAEAGAALQYIL